MTSHSTIKRQRGFSMIEVLVTMIVLSIGLLGLAGLQLNAMRSNHSAYLRSQASTITSDIIDRMLVNRATARAGSYDTGLGVPVAVLPSNCDGDAADNCSVTEMATLDIDQWKSSLSNLLPSGDGTISRAVVGGLTTVTVTIQWDDSRGVNAPTQLLIETIL